MKTSLDYIVEEKLRNALKDCDSDQNDQGCVLYFVGSDDKYIKIGITSCIEDRMNHYNTHNPTEISLIATINMPNKKSAYKLEQNLLATFQKYHVKGEWFSAEPIIYDYARAFQKVNVRKIAEKQERSRQKMEEWIKRICTTAIESGNLS